ncbi:acetyl-CoA carboxylase biotin carboxyl carrier protein subunit [Pseudonocardia sulfidoxydans NBRC 16205]|uniref:Acetyl-CoA carboxylase biotin carboxyl carrier protein subunit n=1 Tax=Pseudonocardia sulfidoxydans NBRC 16205 TaxID=1223511 RepID=A0A511DJJ0_9PSEU|nr:acyl-CoA carboxylase subunit epsilon [Pseudonocardia sulfidoxydans]GEL24979.1 acetyl-CoA carboxylase biotin carboxyl carrier protein subunit [Pseudonocardia sulfidoxydans NBRC 16205]
MSSPSEEQTPEERRALFRVVRGEPSDEEVAALTAVLLAAASSAGTGTAPARRDRWSDPVRRMRGPLRPGPGAWRASALPR